MTENSNKTPMMTSEEVAERLRIGVRTIPRLVERGDLRAVRVGSRVFRFDPDEVERYVAGRPPASDLDAYVERLVAEAPALTEAQRSRLSSLLSPA
jgi:excisionase family DNA binding protein